MKPNFRRVLEEALDAGIGYGVNKAFKHSDSPTTDYIKLQVMESVLNELYEWFDFENSDLNEL